MAGRSAGIVIVTGAAGALGSAVARHLAGRGDAVALLDRESHRGALDALAASLGEATSRACVATCDVSDAASWSAALARVEATLGAPTGAALVAGGWAGGAPLHEGDDAVWSKMIGANLETVHRSLRALLPGFVARRRGSVVVVGSRAVERPWESSGAAAYAASKSAVVALARAVAAEVLDAGVRVNAVLPSTIDTPANRAAMPDADASRWVATSSLAEVIGFLLGDGARDVSGAAIPVYGRG
jgi:NAD(P)-dependent dehydrogenase (short-subunit alcohol dehydrogenase family)